MSVFNTLNEFINSVIRAHRDGVSLASLQLSLTAEGMSGEEVSDLLDLVVLETRNQGELKCNSVMKPCSF